jgi:hypothetical protein
MTNYINIHSRSLKDCSIAKQKLYVGRGVYRSKLICFTIFKVFISIVMCIIECIILMLIRDSKQQIIIIKGDHITFNGVVRISNRKGNNKTFVDQ